MERRIMVYILAVIFCFSSATVWGDNYTGGAMAGDALTTGDYNVFLGRAAGFNITSGSYNVCVGENVCDGTDTSNRNVYVGYSAGPDHGGAVPVVSLTDSNNVVIGFSSGRGLTNGDYNVLVGSEAGRVMTTGNINTFIGFRAGYQHVDGSRNTYVGNNTGASNISGTHNIFIGDHAGEFEPGSYKLYIAPTSTSTPLIYGNFSAAALTVNGSFTATSVATVSDERLKAGIRPLEASLAKIMSLHGVSYAWRTEENPGRGFEKGREIGLIAQQVETVVPEIVKTDEKGFKAVAYDKLVPVLIEGMKEQQKEIAEKALRITKLEKALDELLRRVAEIEHPSKTVAFH